MERKIELNGTTYKVDAEYYFTLTVGSVSFDFTNLGFLDPEFHKAFGFTTVASVLKWWIENRVEILSCVPSSYSHSFNDVITNYFFNISYSTLTHITFDYSIGRDLLEGHLRSPSLSYSVRGIHENTGVFLLVDRQQETTEIEGCSLSPYGPGEVLIMPPRSSRSPSSSTMWDKMYNYTFKMDNNEFDWYRSVAKESNVYFGMELEVSTTLSNKEIQHIVTEVEPKQEPFFIFKQDGSITGHYENRVEFVTVPCTPRYLRKNWKMFFNKLHKLCEDKGVDVSSVFDTRSDLTNGLHIHVDRNSFVSSSHYNKFLTAWNQWDNDVVTLFNAVSGRPYDYRENEYCRIPNSFIAAKPDKKTLHPKFEKRKQQRSLARRLKGIKVAERHAVCHDNSGSTVEVRVFQGIFDLAHVMQSISFTEAIFEYCSEVGYSGFDSGFVDTFSAFITKQRKFASLFTTIEKGKEACA